MKLLHIFRFELAYQLRRPSTWLIFAALFVIGFLMTRDGSLAEALYDDFFLNSPFAIAKTTVVGTLIWLLLAAFVAGEAGARDLATGIHPLTYTLPVSKGEYLGGRFLAAFVLNASILLALQAGILVAVYAPGVDAAVIGPFRPSAYLTAYGFLALPSALCATAIQFSVATRSGRPMAAYLGSLLLFFTSYVVSTFLLFRGRGDLARVLDSIGVHFILSDLSYQWTTYEKSWRLITLEGTVLGNRLLWVGVGLAALAVTYLRFRFAHRIEGGGWMRRWRGRDALASAPAHGAAPTPTTEVAHPAGTGHRAAPAHPALAGSTPIRVPQVRRTLGFGTQVRQTLALARISFRTIATSWAGLFLLGAVPLLTVAVVLDQMSLNGVPLIPRTALVLGELTAPLSAELSRWVIVPLLLVFFAGELVWREREADLGEITDAMPGPEWVPLLGKLLGLGLVLALFQALLGSAGILAQVILGHPELEIPLYLKVLFGLQLIDYLLFAVLALAVHVVVDHKYVGHLAAIMVWIAIVMSSLFGIEHDLLVYGAGPGWTYSEMSGFGPSIGPWLWFKLYWAAWAILLVVVARLLWPRGKETSFPVRVRVARGRITRPTAGAAAAAVLLVLTLGGFVFYNTNLLNEYRTSSEQAALAAEYEQRYKRYERAPQPRMTATSVHVEIHPERREARIRGRYTLLNRSRAAIDSVHVSTVPGAEPEALALDREAALVLSDSERGYRIYDLEAPLEPGDSLRLDFEVRIRPRGFRESGVDPSVVANGTYFTTASGFPAIGYQPSRELIIPRDRREHGLPDRPVIPSLYDEEARTVSLGWAERFALDVVVGTDADQVAVAPGRLRRSWTEGGRRYFEYSTDGPIGTELGYGFFSAAYAVREAKWDDVTIQIFHHPGHTAHVDRMLRSIRASLDYYVEHYGPYPRSYLSVVERPGLGTGMHADAGMITHAGGFTLWSPKEDGASLDLPFAVVAHEMAHQWTVPYAFVEGAPVMSESLAWYYAMQVVRETHGDAQLRRLLAFMRQPYPYPPIRRGEPLLRGLDPWMSYRKGPFALHALSRYVGTERVDAALRHLVEKHRSGTPPLATTLDLYRELQAVTPDTLRYLLHDLFEVNTVWELETERVTAERVAGEQGAVAQTAVTATVEPATAEEGTAGRGAVAQATAEQTERGTWRVTLDVQARKIVADSTGAETETEMDEWVEIGVFAAPGEGGDELSAPIYLEMHRIHSGRQTITVTVPREPALAGIDPYHVLDWEEREDDDNIEPVVIGG